TVQLRGKVSLSRAGTEGFRGANSHTIEAPLNNTYVYIGLDRTRTDFRAPREQDRKQARQRYFPRYHFGNCGRLGWWLSVYIFGPCTKSRPELVRCACRHDWRRICPACPSWASSRLSRQTDVIQTQSDSEELCRALGRKPPGRRCSLRSITASAGRASPLHKDVYQLEASSMNIRPHHDQIICEKHRGR